MFRSICVAVLVSWSASVAADVCPTTASDIQVWSKNLTSGQVISAATNDGSFNPLVDPLDNTKKLAFTYVSQGTTLFSFHSKPQAGQMAGVQRYGKSIGTSTLQNTPIPVPLPTTIATGPPVNIALIFATADGRVNRYDDGGGGITATPVWSVDLRRPTCPTDTILATPAVQLLAFSAAGGAGMPLTDMVFVVTRHMCGDVTGNQVIALNAATGAEVWRFNKFLTHDVDFGSDGCYVDYEFNRLYCGTNLPEDRWQNTLWAINTRDGSLAWSTNAGPIWTRPQRVAGNQRLYVATYDGVVKMFDASDGAGKGTLKWENPVTATGTITRSPWTEFRPGGYAGLLWVVDSSGALHELYDDNSEGILVWSFTGNQINSVVFDPSNSKLYAASASQSKVFQIDPSTGSQTGSMKVGDNGTTSVNEPTLDVIGSSSINRMLVGNQGKLRALCIPWAGGINEMSLGFDDDPVPNTHPAGTLCSSDAQCETGHPELNTACTRGRCDPLSRTCFAKPVMFVGGMDVPSEGRSCPGGDALGCTTNEICRSGVCVPQVWNGCPCPAVGVGRPSCDGGGSCCATGCKNLQSDAANCGACGNVCLAGNACINGECQRDTKRCTVRGNAGDFNFAGISAVTYSLQDAGKFCVAHTMQTSPLGVTQGFRLWTLTGAQTFVPNSINVPETSGVFSTPDGRFTFGYLSNAPMGDPPYPGKPHAHQFEVMLGSLESATSDANPSLGTGPYAGAYLNQGPIGLMVNTKSYVPGITPPQIRGFVANHPMNGDLTEIVGSFTAGANYSWSYGQTFFKTEGGERIDTAAYSALHRPGGIKVGVVMLAHGRDFEVICSRETNGSGCPPRPDGQTWQGNPWKISMPGLTHLGKPSRAYNIAVDHDLYGDGYMEVLDEKGKHQLIRIHGYDLSMHYVSAVHGDHHITAGLLPDPLLGDGRLGLSAIHGVRVTPSSEIGSLPTTAAAAWSLGK
jgi:outer membrane protein assembly factor BamB